MKFFLILYSNLCLIFLFTIEGSYLRRATINLIPCASKAVSIVAKRYTHSLSKRKEHVLQFDWDAFKIGSAEYVDGPTGCTVFSFKNSNVSCVVDIRGGSPGTLFTDSLAQEGCNQLDAIVFTGGSTLGIEAASGVMEEIFKERGQNEHNIPMVSAAVIYDWIFRKNNLYPDKILGSKAYQKAEVGKFLLGQYGAGIGATVGKSYTQQIPPSPGGQGGSFRKTNGIKLAAFTVLNSLGDIYGPFGDVIYGAKLSKEFKENHIFSSLSARDSRRKKGNTTLSLIVTNVNLEHFEMRSLARQMHNSFAEVIRPYGTIFDGDTLYFVSTKEIHLSCRERDSLCFNIGLLASDLIKEAVYSAVNIDR